MGVISSVEKVEQKGLTYPVIQKWKHTGEIILFSSLREGTVLVRAAGSLANPVGKYVTSLVDATDSLWERLPDGLTVTLANGD